MNSSPGDKAVSGRWILAATILGTSMAFIDSTVVNVALPALQKDLNATSTDLLWVVESYALFLAALLLVGGALGDRFGRRKIYSLGVSLFASASFLCGSAPDIGLLIIGRAIQGIGGALLVPGSLAIISASFDGKQRGQAIGTWSGFSAISAAIGPVLGGWLIETVSWRAAFFINLPIAMIVLFLVFRFVPESRNDKSVGRLDFAGAILATGGLGCVVYGLITSVHLGFGNPTVVISLVCGVVALILFLFVESRVAEPMLHLSLFRSRNFAGANLLTFFLYAGLSGTMFFLPLNLIQVQGYSATQAGASLLPLIVIMFLLSRWSGGLISRLGARTPLIIGPIIAGAGFGLFTLPGISHSYWTGFFPAVAVLGLGMAITVAPLTTTVMNSVEGNQSGIASGINNAVSRTAGLIAIAIFGVVMQRSFNHQLDARLSQMNLSQQNRNAIDAQRMKMAGMEVPAGLTEESRNELRRSVAQSFVSSFGVVMTLSSGLAFASALLAGITIEKKAEKVQRSA